jgi:hypothetical protein
MLAVALPDVNGNYDYAVVDKSCGVRQWQTHTFFRILNSNMFNKKEKNQTLCNLCWGSHHHGYDHSYIIPVKWDDFVIDPNLHIEHAVKLREQLNKYDLAKMHQTETIRTPLGLSIPN